MHFYSNRPVVEGSKFARGMKIEFSILFDNIRQNRRKHLPNRCQNVAFCIILPKGVRFFNFRFRANLGPPALGLFGTFCRGRKTLFLSIGIVHLKAAGGQNRPAELGFIAGRSVWRTVRNHEKVAFSLGFCSMSFFATRLGGGADFDPPGSRFRS